MRIAIAGPGRSGTSFLVEFLAGCGFKTAKDAGNYYRDAMAGYESPIDGKSEYEVDKDPYFYEYAAEVSKEDLEKYSVYIIPLRSRTEAVTSRIAQERTANIMHQNNGSWKWNSWGSVPGGAIYARDFENVSKTASEGLWDLLETLTKRKMKIVFLHFPTFAEDFDYLFSSLEPYIQNRVTREQARLVFESTKQPGNIRIKDTAKKSQKVLELESIITDLQKKIHQLSKQIHPDKG